MGHEKQLATMKHREAPIINLLYFILTIITGSALVYIFCT
jgi:hypothetical protein